jgi:hypothetical protein
LPLSTLLSAIRGSTLLGWWFDNEPHSLGLAGKWLSYRILLVPRWAKATRRKGIHTDGYRLLY